VLHVSKPISVDMQANAFTGFDKELNQLTSLSTFFMVFEPLNTKSFLKTLVYLNTPYSVFQKLKAFLIATVLSFKSNIPNIQENNGPF
jgi:hypothetical protein